MKKKLLQEKLAATTAEYEALLKATDAATDAVAHLASVDAKEAELNATKAELSAIESLEAKAKANAKVKAKAKEKAKANAKSKAKA